MVKEPPGAGAIEAMHLVLAKRLSIWGSDPVAEMRVCTSILFALWEEGYALVKHNVPDPTDEEAEAYEESQHVVKQ